MKAPSLPWAGLVAALLLSAPGSGSAQGPGRGAGAADGPTRETRRAVTAGLDWLKRHQNPDGSWGSAGFEARCRGEARCGGAGAGSDLESTGLALLAFLGAGCSHKYGKFHETVKAGVRFLILSQGADGFFGGPAGTARDLRAQAVCALALAEDYALSGRSFLVLPPARKALDALLRAQEPGSGWAAAPGLPVDAATTCWAAFAARCARTAGLCVPRETFDASLRWLDSATDPDTGRVAPALPREAGAQSGRGDGHPLTPTAEALVVRILVLGPAAERRPELRSAGYLLADSPLTPGPEAGSLDEEYLHFAALALFQIGDVDWLLWNESMKTALLPEQETRGCGAGSWRPLGARALRMGRVWATALNTLTLETYSRYGRVLLARRKS